MDVKIRLRRGTSAEWSTANPILQSGEPGFATDTGIFKIGDGLTPWESLPGGTDAAKIGDLTDLTTTDKGSLVGSINEVNTPPVPFLSLYLNAKAG